MVPKDLSGVECFELISIVSTSTENVVLNRLQLNNPFLEAALPLEHVSTSQVAKRK